MLLIRTKLKPSAIHGIGLFADQLIKEGQLVWKFKNNFDIIVTKRQVNSLPIIVKEKFKQYAYLDQYINKYILCFDDARFLNHSDHPNLIGGSGQDNFGIDLAIRDIQIGEELTVDYSEFDAEFEQYCDELKG